MPSRRDSVGGVVAEFFRGLRKPTRFSGGGSSRIFPWSPRADAIQWGGGGVVAEFFPKGGPGPPPESAPVDGDSAFTSFICDYGFIAMCT